MVRLMRSRLKLFGGIMLNWIRGLFERKVTRSEWMNGLLAAESDLQTSGERHCTWAITDIQQNGYDYYMIEFFKGYCAYFDYYKQKLK